MTEIKTAHAWGTLEFASRDDIDSFAINEKTDLYNKPVVIVHGLTEAEVHEAAALLEKSKEVCEWVWSYWGGKYKTCGVVPAFYVVNYCPSCGRKVVEK